MIPETKKIINLLNAAYNKQPWHGESLRASLDNLNAAQAAQRPLANTKPIWEYVLHLIQWRIFCIKKLQNNAAFDIELNTTMDWPELIDRSDLAWKNTLIELDKTQEEFINLLKQMDDSKLEETVSNRTYPFYSLVYGILQHDAYHQGQINLIRKFIRIE